MKNKILIAILFVFVLLAIFISQQFAHPTKWDDIRLGMTQEEVYERIGKPNGSCNEKGAFWYQDKLTQTQVLYIGCSNNKVSLISIRRLIGTENYFYTQNVSLEQNLH